jgi:hypothetical protein
MATVTDVNDKEEDNDDNYDNNKGSKMACCLAVEAILAVAGMEAEINNQPEQTRGAWLGKSPTCRQHVGPTAKSRHIWPTGPRRADTISFLTHFCVSGIADFLQIFSKYQRYVRSNHRTNWYV